MKTPQPPPSPNLTWHYEAHPIEGDPDTWAVYEVHIVDGVATKDTQPAIPMGDNQRELIDVLQMMIDDVKAQYLRPPTMTLDQLLLLTFDEQAAIWKKHPNSKLFNEWYLYHGAEKITAYINQLPPTP